MVFASARVQRYIQFHTKLDYAKAVAFGPFYFLWIGFVEAALVYLAMGLLWGLEGVILAHLVVACLFPVWIRRLMHLRGYEETTRSDVAGRYRRRRTLWPS